MQKKFQVININIFNELTKAAQDSSRKRKNYNLHELSDHVQRFFNAIEPGSYVRPHRHVTPPKTETFIMMRGVLDVVIFDGIGKITDVITLSPQSGNIIFDLLPGAWHSVIAREQGTIYFEVKEGPYEPMSDKDFAIWAPTEGAHDVLEFSEFLQRNVEMFLDKKALLTNLARHT